MKPTDRNKQLYRDMQEAPDKYSDQEIEAMMDDVDQVPDVEEAWLQFNQQHMPMVSPVHTWRKVAAMIVGILMISGIAIAAIHIVRQSQQPTQKQESSTAVANTQPSATTSQSVQTDSIAQPHLYDNVPLGEILSDLSAYYKWKVVYRTDDAPKLRLFYQWKPEYTLEKVVEMLNNFEWLQLELKDDTLYVKSTAIPAHDC